MCDIDVTKLYSTSQNILLLISREEVKFIPAVGGKTHKQTQVHPRQYRNSVTKSYQISHV